MEIENLCVKNCSTCESRCYRQKKVPQIRKKILGFDPEPLPPKSNIVEDARRCIYCYNAPCGQCCPVKINVRDFVHAAACENWYYASKVILSSNPMPLSTGNLCCVKNTCQGGCNLNKSLGGPIKTNTIQLFALREFKKYGLKPVVPESIGKKVAVVGAGPAGLSCSAFLRRFGIDVTIFEKEKYAGGLMMSELTPNRLPLEDIEFEIQMVKDMGVEFKFEQTLGKDFTVDSLIKDMKYDAVFLAFGRPDDIKIDFPCKGAMSSHEFLNMICGVLKLKNGKELPDYTGKKVLVLGAGETAVDCASAASRLGGDVTMAFRKDFQGMRAYPFDIEELLNQKIELLPLVQPVSVEDGEVKFRVQERTLEGKYQDTDQYLTKKYDVVITAFGATLKESKSLVPGEMKEQKVEGYQNVFTGGDLANSFTVVEAVNDAKNAAKMIAEYLGIKSEIPVFKTVIDNVSLETTVDGNKYINPFGLASGPDSGTYECIRNSFKAGFGWAVTKTMMLTKDLSRDNDFRITKCDLCPGQSNSFFNICMLTEHTCEYWLDTIKRLKKEFPDHVIIASIACMDNKEDWQKLTKMCIEAGADGFELNLSCPNEVHGEGGVEGGFNTQNKIGMALGTIPEGVKKITEYVVEVAQGKPVYPKLTPNITDIVEIARGASEGKAAGISAINTINGVPKFFPDGTPFPQVGPTKNTLSGGVSGDCVRPMALRNLSKIHNALPNLSILGIGGIWNSYCALQHLYAGANVFEICSGVQRYSYEIVQEMIAGLQFYLYAWTSKDLLTYITCKDEFEKLPHKDMVEYKEFKEVPKLAELRGIGAKHVVEREHLDLKWTIAAKINPAKCIQCGKCALSCRDNSTEAIEIDSTGRVKIKGDNCVGCGLCLSVCPVGAIEFVKVADKPWHTDTMA